jgi:hypothetical protein
MTDLAVAPTRYPVPPGRGRWRIYIGERSFVAPPAIIIGEIMDARSRRLVRGLNKPASFSFSVDGHSPTARMLRELEHEVMVTRWSDWTGRDEEMFRGIVTQSQDILSEQRHTVNFVAHDLLAIYRRRYLTQRLAFTNTSQFTIASSLWFHGSTQLTTSSGISLMPASYLPAVSFTIRNPDGTGFSGQHPLRTREYPAQTEVGEAVDNLANVINGFDYDLISRNGFREIFPRLFYPYRGVQRYDFAFVFGSTIGSLSRSVNSAAYANYARVVGQSDEGQPQRYAEGWTQDANDIAVNPAGLWMMADSMADVVIQSTLVDRVGGLLETYGVLMPAYSISLRPGAYFAVAPYEAGIPGEYREPRGCFDVGDVVSLQIRSGRLDVDTWVRVYSQTFAIGDDGEENVEAEVARPEPTFIGLFRNADQRLSALERR